MSEIDLTNWTPIGIDTAGRFPIIEWADLKGVRFVDPFFNKTVTRWARSPPHLPCVRTDLGELAALEKVH